MTDYRGASQEAQSLARDISDEIWSTYDDTHGYQTEKRQRNASFGQGFHPDNIWSFWSQFDRSNQATFVNMALRSRDSGITGSDDLVEWLKDCDIA